MQILSNLLVLVLFFVFSSAQNSYFSQQGCRKFDINNNCLQCSFRFYKNLQGVCQPVNPLCRAWDQNFGACLSCYQGYIKIQNICLLSSLVGNINFDLNCRKFNLQNFTCQQCSQGYYFNQDKKCSQIDPNCRLFNANQRKCESCYIGFIQSVNGQCQLIKKINDPYCKIILNEKCLSCFDRFYFNKQGKCQMVNPLCKDYEVSGLCLSCLAGFTLKGKQCIFDKAQIISLSNGNQSNQSAQKNQKDQKNQTILNNLNNQTIKNNQNNVNNTNNKNNTNNTNNASSINILNNCTNGLIFYQRTKKCGEKTFCKTIDSNNICSQCATTKIIKQQQCFIKSKCQSQNPDNCLNCSIVEKEVLINNQIC